MMKKGNPKLPKLAFKQQDVGGRKALPTGMSKWRFYKKDEDIQCCLLTLTT
jgi:hypothetical protein